MSSLIFLPASTTFGLAFTSSFACGSRLGSCLRSCFSIRAPPVDLGTLVGHQPACSRTITILHGSLSRQAKGEKVTVHGDSYLAHRRTRSGLNKIRATNDVRRVQPYLTISDTMSSATILMTLIIGLTAGPAVSLYGSPTVSPVTAALCVSVPFFPCSSINFLALSHAPPPLVIEIATNNPVTMLPTSTPPSACGPRITPTRIGETTGINPGIIIFLMAACVTISTHVPYSGLP